MKFQNSANLGFFYKNIFSTSNFILPLTYIVLNRHRKEHKKVNKTQSKMREDLRINVSFKSLNPDEVELYEWIKSKSKGIGPSGFIKMHLFELMNMRKNN